MPPLTPKAADMELASRHRKAGRTPFEVYCALQCRLLARFVARGGSPEEFCRRLAPAFRRRWGWLLGPR